MRRKFFLSAVFLVASFLYQKAQPAWVTNWEIDPATYLFFSFLPVIWLFQVPSAANGLIAIFFITLTALFSTLKNDLEAENFAILAFFFFSTAVFQQIGEQIRLQKSNEKK